MSIKVIVKIIKNTLVQTQTWTIAEFNYDVLGRRYEKKTGTTTINYVYSNDNVLTEYNTVWNTTTKKEYINWIWTDEVLAVDQEELNLTTYLRKTWIFIKNTYNISYITEKYIKI